MPARVLYVSIQARELGCRASTVFPRGRARVEGALRDVMVDNVPALHVHGVKLVRGAPGKVQHMKPRPSQSNNASPPKRRPVGESLK